MVCNRCKIVVSNVFKTAGIATKSVELGEVELGQPPSSIKMAKLSKELTSWGFEIIDDKRVQTIEKIKNLIVSLVHHSQENNKTNLSVFITAHIFQDYNTLSNLFSEVAGTTIEKYFIAQKIEKVKELWFIMKQLYHKSQMSWVIAVLHIYLINLKKLLG